MGLFSKKPFKQIDSGAWGHLVSVHKIDVDTLSREYRCVERKGMLDGKLPVTFMRVFTLSQVQEKGIAVTGWETFDQHPELILFEGYVTPANNAHLERKQA